MKQELIERYLKMVKLKDIIKRINELEPTAKQFWIDEILKELGSDYGRLKYRSGYEQGKLEGMVEREKVKVPQFVADWIETAKSVYSLSGAMEYGSPGVNKWLENWDNQETFAKAWFFGYEVEKEKKYLVKLKGIEKEKCYLNYNFGGVWLFYNQENFYGYRAHHTRKELEDADFGWVFDCPGIAIEEVEE